MTLACAFVPLTLPPLLLALPLPGAQMLGDCVRGHSTPPLAPPLPDDDPCCAQDTRTAPNGKADEPFAAPSARRLRREPPRYRWHLGCIRLKMPAISVLTGTKSDPNLRRGPLPREQALAFLKDVVDIAFPRLVQNGYYLPDTVRSSSLFPSSEQPAGLFALWCDAERNGVVGLPCSPANPACLRCCDAR